MKGLRIIPVFLLLILLSYLGMLFVEANRDPVFVQFGEYRTPTGALGLVVLTSILFGMLIAGLLCSIELLALYVQNKSLKRRLNALRPAAPPRMDKPLKEVAEEGLENTDANIEPSRSAGNKYNF